MNEPVIAFDVGRMLFGDEPPLFLLEIAVRTSIIYFYTLLMIRWIGSRSISQLTLVEFLLVIALGSAVGDAMFYPDVPLVHCMLVVTVVVLLDKALGFAITRSRHLEDIIEGRTVEVVRDGVIHCNTLNAQNFGHDELFEQLRLERIEQLGEVRAAYLETNGRLSIFRVDAGSERPGLAIQPPWDVSPPLEWKAGTTTSQDCEVACIRCANVVAVARQDTFPACARCGGSLWHTVKDVGVRARGSDARD